MKRGFTLIELLVVMFIIGLLASLVIVNVNESRKTARDTKRMADLKTIKGALEQFNNKNGYYPKTFTGTTPGGGATNPIAGSSGGFTGLCKWFNNRSGLDVFTNGTDTPDGANGWIPNLVPTFLSVLPSDPKPKSDPLVSSNNGCYVYASNGADYKVMAIKTMETVCGAGSTDTCNSTTIQEMARRSGCCTNPVPPAPPICVSGTNNYDKETDIAVYSSGARCW